MKILLIAGHGAGDPGACGCGYKEADLTREVVNQLLPKLKKYAEVDLFDTEKNMYAYLKSGHSFDFSKYDYVFEVHFNAGVKDTAGNGRTTGTEILVHTSESGTTVEEAILKKVCAFGFASRGVKKRSDLLVMNTCKKKYAVSHALIETCFIDDSDDMKLYQSKKSEVIEAIADGIIAGFGLAKSEEDKSMAKFKDTNGHFAEKQIDELFEMGIVNGKGNGMFAPDDPITRAEVAIIARNVIRYITGK